MRPHVVLNVAPLPENSFGSRTLTWWGTIGFMALEGMGFAIAIGAYLYLYAVNPTWPIGASPPDLWPGTAEVVVYLLSIIPNEITNRASHRQDLAKVRIGLIVMALIGITLLVLRGFEFAHLNTRWDNSAYGSIVWLILGLHTTHLATDVGDTE